MPERLSPSPVDGEVLVVVIAALARTNAERRSLSECVAALSRQSRPPEALIVVDDGVETGTVARAAAATLRPLGPARLVLAVPVCSREAMSDLALRYDEILAPVTPMGRRALTWHYAIFDTIDDETARSVLERLS